MIDHRRHATRRTSGGMHPKPRGPRGEDTAQAIARRNWVIDQMADLGWVTRAEARAAIRRPPMSLDLHPEDSPRTWPSSSWLLGG